MLLSFFKFTGVFRKRKSRSTVVTGAPCRAAAALPIKIASRPCRASSSAICASRGPLSTLSLHHCRSQHPFGHGVLERVDTLAGDARYLEVGEPALSRQMAQCGHTLGILCRVHFGGRYDHRLLHQVFTETGQFFHDDFEVVHRLPPAAFGNIHQVYQQARALNMPQELDAQAMAQVRPFDEAGDVGHHEAAEIFQLDHTQIGLKSSERIVGDLRPGRRNPRDQRGLACIRKTHQPHVGQQLQFQAQPFLFAGPAGLMFGGRLVRGGGEMLVAASAPAAARHREALIGVSEIVEPLAGHLVIYHGAHRDLHLDGVAFGAGPLAAFAVAAALGLVLRVETEMQQRVGLLAGHQNHIAAAPAIAAARTAARDVFLPAECQAAVAAVAGLDQNSDFVNKHAGSNYVWSNYVWSNYVWSNKEKPPVPFETGGSRESPWGSRKLPLMPLP